MACRLFIRTRLFLFISSLSLRSRKAAGLTELKQPFECLDRKTGCFDNASHRKRIDRIVAEVIHPREFRHGLRRRYFNDAGLKARGVFAHDSKVGLNRVSNVSQRLGFGFTLGYATRQSGHPDRDPFL